MLLSLLACLHMKYESKVSQVVVDSRSVAASMGQRLWPPELVSWASGLSSCVWRQGLCKGDKGNLTTEVFRCSGAELSPEQVEDCHSLEMPNPECLVLLIRL